MKCEEPIAVLRQVYQMERRIVDLQNRIDALHESATRTTGAYAAGRSSGASDSRIETNVVKSVDLEKQLLRTKNRLLERRAAIQDAIDSMEDEGAKRLIELRYLDHMSWPDVMTSVELSEAACFRLRNRALKEFWKNFSK